MSFNQSMNIQDVLIRMTSEVLTQAGMIMVEEHRLRAKAPGSKDEQTESERKQEADRNLTLQIEYHEKQMLYHAEQLAAKEAYLKKNK